MKRQLRVLKHAVDNLLGGLNPSRNRLSIARSISTYGIVLGISISLSAVVFPRFPAQFFSIFLGDYTHILEALVVSEQLFSLILGISILIVSSIIHFVIDIYMDTLPAFWAYSGDAFLRVLMLISFSVSFALTRILVVQSEIVGPNTGGSAWIIPVSEVWIRGYHIHHFFFGFLFLTIAGWFAIFDTTSRAKIAVLYGVGLGIIVDEFGMLLTEGDYFATSSYFLAVFLASLVLVGIHWDRLAERTAVGIDDLIEE